MTFTVSDDGPGFRKDILPHAFEPFVGSDTNAGGGAGLGLAIARFIASAHGGDATAVNRRPAARASLCGSARSTERFICA